MNHYAGPGQVFVCSACGKRSKDKIWRAIKYLGRNPQLILASKV